MFYSHQLLARKAPLGQIWMAATMHAKINRRKLDKLNIIKICEEILNPSVPMALRLSGILMGGVVIVYERKVKLLYDDVTRLLVEINEAWKVKSVSHDPTVLPKGKSQAKKEAVTLPENQETDVGDFEQSVNYSNANPPMEFQRTAYIAMRLDDVDEPFINNDTMEEDVSQQFHQADPDNIKLYERFDLRETHTEMYNRYERFDIEEDGETQLNFTSGEHMEIPTSLIPSPPKHDETTKANESQDNQKDINPQADERKIARQGQQRHEPTKKKTKRHATPAMDYEQTIIPGPTYQFWLQNASDIVSRKGKRRKVCRNIMSTMKVASLMELPPLVLIDDLYTNAKQEIHYPAPLLELWMRSTQPPHDSPSARTSAPLPPEPSSSSPLGRGDYQEPTGYPFGDLNSGVGSQSLGSLEKMRRPIINEEMPMDILGKLLKKGSKTAEANLTTPGNSGDEVRSIPSSGSGHGISMPSHQSEVHSGRKRPYSGSRHSGSSLEPVVEENPWLYPESNFKLSRLSEYDPTPDPELLVETGPTQTQRPIINQPVDKMTDTIRMQMKAHFEAPGAPEVESLTKLAAGLNRKGAALLFYQTCVLASIDTLRVEQNVPYGEILISKGKKM